MSRAPRGWTGPHVESQDPRAERLLLAAREGKSARVLELLDAGVDIDSRDSIGWTPLMEATRGRHLDLMTELIARGANLDFENSFYYAALTLAAIESTERCGRQADPRPLEMLMAAGASLTLHEAVYLNDLNLARRRLEAGDDPDTAEGSYQGPILMKAADDGNLTLVDLLLEFGANIEALDDLNQTPLVAAVTSDQVAVARRLLDCGANVHPSYVYSQTVLSIALSQGQAEMVELLRSRGARWSPIDALILDDMPLLEALLDEVVQARAAELAIEPIEDDLDEEDSSTKWIRMSAVDRLGNSARRLALEAASRGNVEALALLLNRGASLLLVGIDDHSLLAEAARCGQVEAAQFLLDQGADLQAIGEDGSTPLAWAIKGNQAGAADLLRRAGAFR